MKTFVIFVVSVIIYAYSGNDVCPKPATLLPTQAPEWEEGSIYEISFSDGCPMIKGKEVLLSVPLSEAIKKIQLDCNTAYGDFLISYKFIGDEDIYIANLLDEFVEL